MKIKSEYIKLLVFFTAVNIFGTFSGSVLPVHYFESGITMTQMVTAQLIIYLSHLTALVVIRSFSAKIGFYFSTIFSFVQLLLIIHIQSLSQFYLSAVVAGFVIHFLFTSYNIGHFTNTNKENVGVSSGLMFSIPRLIGIVFPLIAGYIVGLDIKILWIISGIMTFLTVCTIPQIRDFRVTYTILGAIRAAKSVRMFLVLEGIWEALIFAVIPIYTLKYIHTPEEFGIFVAYIGLVGVIANMTIGKVTDSIRKRAVFLFPITFLLTITTYLFPYFDTSQWGWFVITGLTTFLVPLFWNLTFALVLDNTQNHSYSIPGREILLDVGRIIGLGATVLSFTYEKTPFLIYYFLGTAMLGFFLNLTIRRIFKSHSYV